MQAEGALFDLPQHWLSEPLPGVYAQRKFEPELSFGRHAGPFPHDSLAAGVIVLLYPKADAWHIPLVVRPGELRRHAGQVCLPGGVVEAGETEDEAVLRELEEELGVTRAGVTILRRMTPLLVIVSNYRVQPTLAATRFRPHFQPNPAEVAELLEVPLGHLASAKNLCTQVRTQQGVEFEVPCLDFQGHKIWGATAMILGELVALVGDPVADA
jgi:8-oxo-dGTP pyrophosphatase MutT (NUDIX family)